MYARHHVMLLAREKNEFTVLDIAQYAKDHNVVRATMEDAVKRRMTAGNIKLREGGKVNGYNIYIYCPGVPYEYPSKKEIAEIPDNRILERFKAIRWVSG